MCIERKYVSAGKRNLSVSVSFVPLNFPYRLNASHMTRQGCCSAVSVVELSTVRLTLNPIVIFGLISMYTLEKMYLYTLFLFILPFGQ